VRACSFLSAGKSLPASKIFPNTAKGGRFSVHPERLLLALIFPLLVCFLSGCGGTGKQQGFVFALEFVF
jgi:hypothetical protein